jgi:hypothetical protein
MKLLCPNHKCRADARERPLFPVMVPAHPVKGLQQTLKGFVHPVKGSGQTLKGFVHPMKGSHQTLKGFVHPVKGLRQTLKGFVHPMKGLRQTLKGFVHPMKGLRQTLKGFAAQLWELRLEGPPHCLWLPISASPRLRAQHVSPSPLLQDPPQTQPTHKPCPPR